MSNLQTAGHTALLALKQERAGYYCVTLECSCGQVFAQKFCLPSEQASAKELVFDEGQEKAKAHIARIAEAVKTIQAGQPCAA